MCKAFVVGKLGFLKEEKLNQFKWKLVMWERVVLEEGRKIGRTQMIEGFFEMFGKEFGYYFKSKGEVLKGFIQVEGELWFWGGGQSKCRDKRSIRIIIQGFRE